MQRLNAIMAFIEGEFPLNGNYFNLDTIASTKDLKDKGVLIQKSPIMDRHACKIIASYPIPFSVTSIDNEDIIDDVFKRINSSGRHLSNQELRQAGLDNSFGFLVRKISESIRGDVSTSDKLLLNNMKAISINNHNLSYGINMGGIFWRKHNIVSNENIRQSRDEEMVAHLVGAILITPRPAATATNLDNFYSLDHKKNKIILDQVKKLGHEYIVNLFQAVFAEFKKTFESTKSSFYKIMFKNETTYVNRSFQVVFLAFYELLVKEQKFITNYVKLANSLKGVGDIYLTPNSESLNLSGPREKAINAIKGICSESFAKRKENDPALNNGVIKLESILSASKTENTSYDFKIGTHRIHGDNSFDENSFTKMLKTLTAIVNAGKESVGYVILGVADDEKDKESFENYYNAKSLNYRDFFITGLESEVKNYKNHDEYRMKLENIIKNSNISPSSYKDQILNHIDYFTYYDKSVLIMKIEAMDEPARFDNKYYERHGTKTIEVASDKEKNIWKRFL